MTDITTITSALQSIKTATEIANLLRQGDLSLEKAEVKMKLADLVTELSEIKLQLADVRHAVMERDEKIIELERRLKLKEQLLYEAPYYWIQENNSKAGPFCQKCYDTDEKLIRLQGSNNGFWTCKACTSSYKDKTYVPPQRTVAESSNWLLR